MTPEQLKTLQEANKILKDKHYQIVRDPHATRILNALRDNIDAIYADRATLAEATGYTTP